MESAKNVGRVVGLLVLLQSLGGAVMNFALMRPVIAAPGFLVNAAEHPMQVSLAVMLGLVLGALSVGIAITAWPVFRQHSRAMALWFLALTIVGFSLAAFEAVANLSMLSLSQAHAKAAPADAAMFQGLKGVVGSVRNGAHYIGLICAGAMVFVLYGVLYRFALVPRALAALGLIAVLLQLVAVTMPVFGHRIMFQLIAPLGLTHLALTLWLLAKGFANRGPSVANARTGSDAIDHR